MAARASRVVIGRAMAAEGCSISLRRGCRRLADPGKCRMMRSDWRSATRIGLVWSRLRVSRLAILLIWLWVVGSISVSVLTSWATASNPAATRIRPLT